MTKKLHKKVDTHTAFNYIMAIVISVLLLANQTFAMHIAKQLLGPQPGEKVELSGNFAQDIAALVTPVAIPFYGPELGLDFSSIDSINTSIDKMSVMAPMQGSSPIELNEEEMERYVAVGTEPTVTCEFCCGVKTLVRKDGSPTCGCAHSIAMRGTAAYLIRNYPDMSNAEIAYELMRQKGLYFPKQMQQRMAEELAGEAEEFTPDIRYLTQNLTQNELENLQQKALKEGFIPPDTTDMVGGC